MDALETTEEDISSLFSGDETGNTYLFRDDEPVAEFNDAMNTTIRYKVFHCKFLPRCQHCYV